MLLFSFLFLSLAVSILNAVPLTNRDVISPHITKPDANTKWPVGSIQTVSWDTSDIPANAPQNLTGMVVLGHLGPTGGENLQLNNPLAKNFQLRDGKVQVTVPSVPPRDDYIVVLFGDSGNASPTFVITSITSGGGGGSNSSTPQPDPTTTTTQGDPSSTLITDPIPITGSTITGGLPSVTPSPPIATAPSSSSSPSSSPSEAQSSPTATAPSSSSSAISQSSTTTTTNSASASGPLSLSLSSFTVGMASALSLVLVLVV